jgi:hypothetical protein
LDAETGAEQNPNPARGHETLGGKSARRAHQANETLSGALRAGKKNDRQEPSLSGEDNRKTEIGASSAGAGGKLRTGESRNETALRAVNTEDRATPPNSHGNPRPTGGERNRGRQPLRDFFDLFFIIILKINPLKYFFLNLIF